MIIEKVCITAIGATSGLLLAQASVQAPWLEYGALGLCGAMVMMNYVDRRELVKDMRSMREKTNELIETNTAALQGVKDVIGKCKKPDS